MDGVLREANARGRQQGEVSQLLQVVGRKGASDGEMFH